MSDARAAAGPHPTAKAAPLRRAGGEANEEARAMADLIKLTAAEIAAKIAAGEVTAVEVTEAHLARIEAVDEKVHAFLHVDREGALARPVRSTRSAPAAKSSVRWPVSRSRSRTSSRRRGSPPPSARRSSKAGSRRTTRR